MSIKDIELLKENGWDYKGDNPPIAIHKCGAIAHGTAITKILDSIKSKKFKINLN